MTQSFWDKEFEAFGEEVFTRARPEIREIAGLYPSTSRVLDLGAGIGQNAIPFAERGMHVTCIDDSEVACRRLGDYARKNSLDIDIQRRSVTDFEFPDTYDVIIAHGILQFIEPTKSRELVSKIKAHTNPGGRNIINVVTSATPIPNELADLQKYPYGHEEIFNLYSDWERELQESYTIQSGFPPESQKPLSIDKLVSRKP